MKTKLLAFTRQHAEWIAVLAVFFAVWALLAWFLYWYNMRNQLGDGAFAAQIFYNFKETPWQTSSFAVSTLESMKTIWYKPAEFVCKQPLVAANINQPLTFHFYLIGYLFLPLAKVINPYLFIALLQAGIYTSVLLFTYAFARRVGLSRIVGLLAAALVTQLPVWYSGLYGQFYFNRLFLPLCALVIWQLHNKKRNPILLSLTVLLALSTNEIYGVTLATLLLVYAVCFERKTKLFYILAVASFGASFLMLRYIQAHYGQFTTQSGFISSITTVGPLVAIRQLITNVMTQNTLIFLTVNFCFIGILTVLRWRYAVALLLFLAPNLLVNIGGAEKIGWTTHYHIAYVVPLIWLSILALKESKLVERVTWGRISIILLLFILSTLVDPEKLVIRPKPYLAINDIQNKLSYYHTTRAVQAAYHEKLAAAVTPGQSISLPEAVAYHFIDHPIYYYPMNIDLADKVVFLYDPNKAGDDRFTTPNYGQQDPKLDFCIIQRMKLHGYNFDSPTIVDQWAIIGK